jgi:hypothetical protein
MTALGGGGRPTGDPHPMSSRSDLPGPGGAGQPRPLEQIFPLRGDANRAREMQATWRSFCRDRLEAVRGVLEAGRSPPEIAYQLGELLHNHFRTRGVTLTSYELRRLVAELLALHGPAEEAHEPLHESPTPPPAAETETAPAKPEPVVAFEREPPKSPWPGDAPPPPSAPAPKVPEKALEPPPSPIVTVSPRESAPFEGLLGRALDLAKGRLGATESPAPRAVADQPVAGVAGPSLIDRLWSDRAVRALFINGPHAVSVEREGTVQAVAEGFRDEAQLTELVTRLVGRPASGMADFRLRDGSTGFVIFPPAAPGGPVLSLRRAEAGQATLEGLVSVGMLDRPVAELLRLCVRARLNLLVAGPSGSGKTALLAALIRDLDPALRLVTVASHRHFQQTAASRVELVTSAAAPFAMLMAAASRLDAGLLVLDGVSPGDAASVSDRLRQGPPGVVAAIDPETLSALARAVDLVVRIDRVDGQPRVLAVEDCGGMAAFALEDGKLARGKPAFAAILQARGQGEALAKLLP